MFLSATFFLFVGADALISVEGADALVSVEETADGEEEGAALSFPAPPFLVRIRVS